MESTSRKWAMNEHTIKIGKNGYKFVFLIYLFPLKPKRIIAINFECE